MTFTADYINFMRQVTPETTQEYMTQLKRFNMGSPGESDCPVFDGMYEYFSVSALARCNVQHELGHCCTAAAVCVCMRPSCARRRTAGTHAPCTPVQLLSGGSVDGAAFLAEGKAEIAFNWSGAPPRARPLCAQPLLIF